MVLNDLYLLPVHLAAAGSMRSILVLLQTFLLEILLTSTFYTLIIIPFHFVSQWIMNRQVYWQQTGRKGPYWLQALGHMLTDLDGLLRRQTVVVRARNAIQAISCSTKK